MVKEITAFSEEKAEGKDVWHTLLPPTVKGITAFSEMPLLGRREGKVWEGFCEEYVEINQVWGWGYVG